jgi:hypothetical protein
LPPKGFDDNTENISKDPMVDRLLDAVEDATSVAAGSIVTKLTLSNRARPGL